MDTHAGITIDGGLTFNWTVPFTHSRTRDYFKQRPLPVGRPAQQEAPLLWHSSSSTGRLALLPWPDQ